MTALLVFPLLVLFFAASDLWSGHKWRRHASRCPCPYGPYSCDRGNRL